VSLTMSLVPEHGTHLAASGDAKERAAQRFAQGHGNEDTLCRWDVR